MSTSETKLPADDAWSEIQKIIARCDPSDSYSPAGMVRAIRETVKGMHNHERSLERPDPDFGKQEASILRGQLTLVEVLLGMLDGTKLKHVTPPFPPSDSPPGQRANRIISPN